MQTTLEVLIDIIKWNKNEKKWRKTSKRKEKQIKSVSEKKRIEEVKEKYWNSIK